MSILSATITQAELLAVYEAERRPEDPPLDVLARHTARYTAEVSGGGAFPPSA